MHGDSLLVLAGTQSGRVELRGHLAGHNLRVRVNGMDQSLSANGDFTVQADIPSAADDRPAPLRRHTLVEIAAEGQLSISAVTLL